MSEPAPETAPIATMGLHHLGLTVADIDASTAFFCNVLNFKVVGEKPDYPARFVSDGTIMLTLWQVRATPFNAFDRQRNVGLHHFALKVADVAMLTQLHERLLATEDVTIEFAPEPLNGLPVQHMMCTIPGGLRVEFIAAA